MEEILATSISTAPLQHKCYHKLNMLQRHLVTDSQTALHAICISIHKYKTMQHLEATFMLRIIKKLILCPNQSCCILQFIPLNAYVEVLQKISKDNQN